MTTTSVTQEVQDQVLGAIRKSQEVTLDAVKKVVETMAAAQAKLPAPFDGKIPSLPLTDKLSELPQLSDLPEPEAVVSSAFDFLGQLLAEQRKFATELIKATAPLRPTLESRPAAEDAAEDAAEPAAAAKPAAAKRSAATKPAAE
jgi:hypothetical protein